MYTITKQFAFSASHVLEELAPEHPCSRLHGHNYVVEIVLRAEALDARGFVVDYFDLNPVKDVIDAELDHRHLNDVLDGPASAEAVARWLFERAAGVLGPEAARCLVAMRVSETPKTWAEYAPTPT